VSTVPARESAALSAWYCSRPEIRRLRAIRDTEGLRVLVELEPAQDSNEMNPAWIANRDEWIDELQGHTGATVRLEHAIADDEAIRGVIVADLFWRDPSSPSDHE
jgi:hypothetical protein